MRRRCVHVIGHGRSQNHLPVCGWGVPVWWGGWGGPSESQRGKRPDEGGQRGKGPQGLQQPPGRSPAVGKQRPAIILESKDLSQLSGSNFYSKFKNFPPPAGNTILELYFNTFSQDWFQCGLCGGRFRFIIGIYHVSLGKLMKTELRYPTAHPTHAISFHRMVYARHVAHKNTELSADIRAFFAPFRLVFLTFS